MVNKDIVVDEKRTREIELSNAERERRFLCRRWRIILDLVMNSIDELKQEMYLLKQII